MKGILTFFLLTISILSIAQNETSKDVQIDERLYEVFEKEHLTNLQTKNPFLLKRWAYYLDHSFYISDYPRAKGNPEYPEVKINDLENINILLLEKKQSLNRDFDKQMVYKINGTNKVLVYLSGKEFNEKLNVHLGRK